MCVSGVWGGGGEEVDSLNEELQNPYSRHSQWKERKELPSPLTLKKHVHSQ